MRVCKEQSELREISKNGFDFGCRLCFFLQNKEITRELISNT